MKHWGMLKLGKVCLAMGSIVLMCLSPVAGQAQAEPTAASTPGDAIPTSEPAQGSGVEAMLLGETPVVYGAAKYEQKITEAPASVTIVTADQIRKYGYRTLIQVLQSVPGLFATYDRDCDYLGVCGLNRPGDFNSRVLLLIDGHRLNDAVYDQAPFGTDSPIDVDLSLIELKSSVVPVPRCMEPMHFSG